MQNNRNRIQNIIEAHKKLVASLKSETIEAITAASDAIINSIKNGGTIYICGNGGSAADAQHIASELVGKFERQRKGLPAIALTTDTSALTSIANDYSYENVFARQLEALVRKVDLLWAISTSGSSANVVEAVKTAKQKGALILAFTGKKGSKLENLSDICFCAGSDSTARSQEIHQLAYHIICNIVEQNFCKK